VWRAITATLTVEPVFFKELLIQTVMSVAFVDPFLRTLRKKKKLCFLCKMVLQYTLPIIPLTLKSFKTDMSQIVI
jgi:hypothetical protein